MLLKKKCQIALKSWRNSALTICSDIVLNFYSVHAGVIKKYILGLTIFSRASAKKHVFMFYATLHYFTI